MLRSNQVEIGLIQRIINHNLLTKEKVKMKKIHKLNKNQDLKCINHHIKVFNLYYILINLK